MAEVTRKSVLFVTDEVTSGTPVAPSAANQAIALQDGFTLTPNFESLENDELRSSIGKASPTQGKEQIEAEVAHYLRHSGVEGQEPNYGNFLQSLFGAKSVNATQYTTSASSTAGTSLARATIKSTGNASNFERGEALLIKDSVNGFSIRNVYSIDDANTLGLAFNLAAAPGSGVGLGKAVLYKPADSGENSMTFWEYRANGGAIEMIAGVKTASMSLDITAGELINADFSFQGIGYYFNPIIIASTDRYLDFTDDDGTWAVAITAKAYKDPHDVAEALTSAMNASGTTETHSVIYNDSGASAGKFTISTSTSTVLSLLWNTGANTANTIGDKLGFSVAADDTGATTYTSDSAITLTAPYTPTYDSSDPLVAKDMEIMLGDFDDYACACAQSITLSIDKEIVDVDCICSESGVQEKIANSREVTMEISSVLTRYDADKFHRFHSNSDIAAAINFGVKSGGNWVPGKAGNIYLPIAKISSFELDDNDGVVVMNITLTAYVDNSGNGEVYLNFV